MFAVMFPPEGGNRSDGIVDWTARQSRSHLKSTAPAGICQELRWTRQTTMACSSVTAKFPQFVRRTEQK